MKRASFVGLHFKSEDKMTHNEITKVLTILRWDCRFGFPGGMQEDCDNNCPLDTVIRETHQEIGLLLDKHKLKQVSINTKRDIETYFYSYEGNQEEIDSILLNIGMRSIDHNEVSGVNILHCTNHNSERKDKGINHFLEYASFAGTGKEDLIQLLDFIGVPS